MKKTLCFLLAGLIMTCLAACDSAVVNSVQNVIPCDGANSLISDCNVLSFDMGIDSSREDEAIMQQNIFYVSIGEKNFSAIFADNSGAQALKELLADGDITIQIK